MTTRALVLVHDPAPSRRDRIPGALIPALADRDIKHDVTSFVGADETIPELDDYDLLIVMGSHESAYDQRVPWLAGEFGFVTDALDRDLPILGICFGAQLLARALGETVARALCPEHGFTSIDSDDAELVTSAAWMQMHSDSFTPPPGAIEVARNASGSQAFVAGKVLGVQFHPEMILDSFESCVERWDAAGELPDNTNGSLDIQALRREIAYHQSRTIRACDQLVGTFCSRHLPTGGGPGV